MAAVLAISGTAFAEDQFSLATGFDYSTGKYGTSTTTDILYVPVVAKYETGDWTFKLTVPYVSVTGTSSGVIRGMGRVLPSKGAGKAGAGMGMGTTTTTTTSNSASGLGDVVAAVGYNIYDQDELALDLVGKAKLGTANENQGLGTGKNDYSAQLDGYYTVGKTTAFATAGYKVVGVPAGFTLNNVAFGTLGASRKLGDKTSAGVMLDVMQSASPLGTAPVEATFFVTKNLSKTLKVQANVLKGFSKGSPNVGAGAMIISIF
jgi:hypothetical protein